jgi:AraC-like DNA-binding protein
MRLEYCGLLPRAWRSLEPHTHVTYEFHYVVGGHGTFELQERHFPIGAGDVFYTRPGTEHRVMPADGDYLLQYVAWLELDPVLDAECAMDLDTGFGEGRTRRLGDRHHALFAEISRLCRADDAYQRRVAAFKLVAVLYEVMAGIAPVHHAHPAVARALEIMRGRVGQPYRLQSVVAELGIEKAYFIRLFKKSVGVTPMRYAMSLKMSVAADLLRGSAAPLAVIAQQVGFADEYHFAKCFKQWSGRAPGAYRRGDAPSEDGFR